MGSWNHTCAISNLHIHAGQDVAVFLLVKNVREDSFCYSNALYRVMPMPFYGKYDDYGGVEECHGLGIPIILDALKSRLYKFGQGPNEYHDCEVTPETLTIEKVFEADHEGRLGIDDPRSWNEDEYSKSKLEEMRLEKGLTDSQQFELDRLASKIKKQDTFRRVTHVVVHGDIFKAILEKWYIEDYVGDGKGTTGYGKNYNHIYFKDLIGSIPEFIARKKAAREELEKEMGEMYNAAVSDPAAIARMRRMLSRSGRSDWNDPCLALRWMNYFEGAGEGNPWELINVQEMVSELVEAQNWSSLAEFVKEVLTAAWINSFMSRTRRIWVKQSGAGSQNSEPLGYQVLAQATLDVLEAERLEYAMENDEDDEAVDPEVQAEAEEYFMPKGPAK